MSNMVIVGHLRGPGLKGTSIYKWEEQGHTGHMAYHMPQLYDSKES